MRIVRWLVYVWIFWGGEENQDVALDISLCVCVLIHTCLFVYVFICVLHVCLYVILCTCVTPMFV